MMSKKKWRWSFRNKLVLYYVLIIVLPSCFVLTYIYGSMSNSVEYDISQSILQTVKQMESNIYYKLAFIEQTSNSICYNEKIQEVLRYSGKKSVEDEIADQKRITAIFMGIGDSVRVDGIRIYVPSERLYSSENVNFFDVKRVDENGWFERAYEKDGGMYWQGSYLPKTGDKPSYIVSCARMIKDLQMYYNGIGYLSIDMKENYFFDVIDNTDMTWSDQVFIVDGSNTIIAGKDKSLLGQKSEKIEAIVFPEHEEEGIVLTGKGRDKDYTIYKNIRNTDWKIVINIGRRQLFHGGRIFGGMLGINFLLILFFLLFVLAAVGVIINVIQKKIHSITDTMQTEGLSYLDNIEKGNDGDEIVQLQHGIEHLIKMLNVSIQDAYQSKINERDASLKALQAQINPHFLYNTLDIINWMAIKRGATDISTMLDMLAQYFRLSLSKGRDIVALKDEIELTKVYFGIQENRFKNKFTVTYHIDPDVLDYSFPKLTLQPFVENALLHGLNRRKNSFISINIEAYRADDLIILTVKDNGVGINVEKLNHILNDQTDGEWQHLHSGYGIYNARKRIELFCHDDQRNCGVFISSVEGAGTTVTIKMIRKPLN